MTLRELRIHRNMSQAQLGSLIGKTGVAVSRYENGIRTPDPETAELIAKVFGLSIEDLWGMFYAGSA